MGPPVWDKFFLLALGDVPASITYAHTELASCHRLASHPQALHYVRPSAAAVRFPVPYKKVSRTKWGRVFTFYGPAKSRSSAALNPAGPNRIFGVGEEAQNLPNPAPQCLVVAGSHGGYSGYQGYQGY